MRKKLAWQIAVALYGAATMVAASVVIATLTVARDGFVPAEWVTWIVGLCAACAAAAPLVAAIVVARRVAGALGAFECLGKSMIAGAAASAPASGIREAEEVGEKLAHAANVVRARELALRTADRAKDEFLATLGHELRNPLSAQAAAAHVLRHARSADPDVVHASGVISRQVQRMTRLVEDLLDVSRVIRGKASLNRQPLNLAQAVEEVVQELREAGRLEGHTLSLDLAEVWSRADEARIEQIVANLIGNALKYTPAGGSIEVTLRRDRDAALLRVRDTGIGMSPDLAMRVFELFVQGEDATAGRGAGGLGIGLTLVKHLAELHGGKAFAASSGPGQGAVFTVSLPAIEAPAVQAPVDTRETQRTRHRIVLVEDNAETRDMMFSALQMDGHRVYEAQDATHGLEAIDTLHPDAAVIDIGLPDMNGFEMAAALRGRPDRRRMVLIAVTGRETAESPRRAREAGFDDYVVKPIEPDRLVRLIDAAIARRAH